MKATELRQNNLVTDEFYETFKTIIKVNSINDKGINLEIVDDGNWSEIAQRWIEPEYTFDKLRPIQLTEEILLKCKGVKSSYTSNPELIGASKKYNLGSIIIFQQNEDESVFYTCINEDMDNLIVDTLHQLQNLYFALTGQELEINL